MDEVEGDHELELGDGVEVVLGWVIHCEAQEMLVGVEELEHGDLGEEFVDGGELGELEEVPSHDEDREDH